MANEETDLFSRYVGKKLQRVCVDPLRNEWRRREPGEQGVEVEVWGDNGGGFLLARATITYKVPARDAKGNPTEIERTETVGGIMVDPSEIHLEDDNAGPAGPAENLGGEPGEEDDL